LLTASLIPALYNKSGNVCWFNNAKWPAYTWKQCLRSVITPSKDNLNYTWSSA